MPAPGDPPTADILPSTSRVHVIGAGPVGLLLTALLQSTEGFSVHLYEKRREYTRTRMVQLASYLVADSVESYCVDYIDGESVTAIFEPPELAEGLAFRQSIPPDLMALLRAWARGILSAQHHRALAQRPDRRAPVRSGAAHRGRSSRRRTRWRCWRRATS